jgi:hypothetical protein
LPPVLSVLVGEIHCDVTHAAREELPGVLAEVVARVLLHGLFHPVAELVVRLFRTRDANDREVLRQQTAIGERVERRKELAFRQVA